MNGPSPAIILYTKPGCGLCDEARALLEGLLAQRAAAGRPIAPVEERNILTDEAWERAFFLEIPVVEVGQRRLTLVTSPAKLRLLLAETLDGVRTAT
ncbi:MAG TPA: glutaredoxin family protein [Candidatus Limnocylindria bacterium]|nr:glutaredoxin family protein [Candidatus Limnocylindria bacterium]